MSAPVYSVAKPAPELDLAGFNCGAPAYNDWLIDHAATSVQAGVCAVYVLIESDGAASRVVGYYAISPTQVVRDEAPQRMARGWPRSIPAWRLGKLAVHVDLRADEAAQWGRQLLRHALETVVAAADVGGGKVVVVDADNAGLVEFYLRNGFATTGRPGDLTLFVTVATLRKALSAPR